MEVKVQNNMTAGVRNKNNCRPIKVLDHEINERRYIKESMFQSFGKSTVKRKSSAVQRTTTMFRIKCIALDARFYNANSYMARNNIYARHFGAVLASLGKLRVHATATGYQISQGIDTFQGVTETTHLLICWTLSN